jgi:hypothetical protein
LKIQAKPEHLFMVDVPHFCQHQVRGHGLKLPRSFLERITSRLLIRHIFVAYVTFGGKGQLILLCPA